MERGLRIAILCPGYGRVVRGVETFTGELANRLLSLRPDWRVDIFSRGPNAQLADGIRVVHVPTISRDSRLATLYAQIGHRLGLFLRTRIDAECLSFAVAVAPKLLRSHYDVIFNQAGPFAGTILRAKRRLDGTPFVHKTASGYGELELIMAMQRPDAIVATSPYVKHWLEQRTSRLNIRCIPNAVDRTAFRPYSPTELEAARDGLAAFRMKPPIVLFVGAMDPMKRPDLLIRAVERLPLTSLIMIGQGQIAGEISRLGAERLGDRFLYVPSVDREQMPLYYNACDVFTLPSEEPFGIVFLEAMACNKPVLGHNSPVQRWIFGDAGATCDCTDPGEYARAIAELLSSDFGDRPFQRSKMFDWSEVAPQYVDLFSQTVSLRGKR